MTYRTNDAYQIRDDVDYEPEEPPRRWRSLIVVMALAMVGIVSAFLWRAYGGSRPVFPSFTSNASAPVSPRHRQSRQGRWTKGIFRLFSNSWRVRCRRQCSFWGAAGSDQRTIQTRSQHSQERSILSNVQRHRPRRPQPLWLQNQSQRQSEKTSSFQTHRRKSGRSAATAAASAKPLIDG